MREMKFRAWDKGEQRMIVDEQTFIPLLVTNKGVMRLNPHHEENLYSIADTDRFELMQYTGLQDKNGTDIYEGDIIRNHWYNVYKDFIGNDWVVEYGAHSTNGFAVETQSAYGFHFVNGEETHSLNTLPGKIEVIGNIYESKEE